MDCVAKRAQSKIFDQDRVNRLIDDCGEMLQIVRHENADDLTVLRHPDGENRASERLLVFKIQIIGHDRH